MKKKLLKMSKNNYYKNGPSFKNTNPHKIMMEE